MRILLNVKNSCYLHTINFEDVNHALSWLKENFGKSTIRHGIFESSTIPNDFNGIECFACYLVGIVKGTTIGDTYLLKEPARNFYEIKISDRERKLYIEHSHWEGFLHEYQVQSE